MNLKGIYYLMVVTAVFCLTACSKSNDNTPDSTRKGTFSLEFDNIVGDETLAFESRDYKNTKGETFRVKTLRYFISNIKLYQADGSEYIVPQDSSYFLVDGTDRSSRFASVNVPEGDYTKVKFILGVDSVRSTLPVEDRQGVLSLDGNGDMYWGWNSGYIFFKLEGTSDVVTAAGDPTGNHQFKYHIGGFGGYSTPTINNIKEITVDLTAAGVAQVRSGYRSNAHLFVDILNIFNGPYPFSIAEHPSVMSGTFSQSIANNFSSMFSHDHTENFVRNESEL